MRRHYQKLCVLLQQDQSNGGKMDQKLMIGEILIKRKLITQEQLDEALDIQKKEKGFIGEILVKLGYLEEQDIVVALVVQCDLPYIAINKYDVMPEILKMIPKDVAMRERIVPLDCIGNILSVVMMSPCSEEKKVYLEEITKCKVATFISTKTEIDQAIQRLY